MLPLHEQVTVVLPIHRTDGDSNMLQQAIGSLPARVPYLVVENDGEVGAAINHGVAQANTRYVYIMGADDLLAPSCLELLLDQIWDADATYPTLVLVNEDLHVLEERPAALYCPNRLTVRNYITGASLFDKGVFQRIGGMDPTLEGLEDWDLMLHLSRAGHRLKPVPEARYYYRQREGSRNTLVTAEQLRERIVGDVPALKATFYYQATPAVAYWRCLLPARHLPGQAVNGVAIGNDGQDFPEHRGSAIWQFPGSAAAWIVIASMQQQEIRCLVEVDDNYFTQFGSIRKRAGWKKKTGQGENSMQGHRAIVELADGVIVATETLARAYRKHNANVHVCPNQIDPADWPEPDKPDDGIFRIGWFGSRSHGNDARLVERALAWASEQKGVEVVCIGGVGATAGRPWWSFPFRHSPFTNDMGVYRKLLGALDVGLAPIVPDPWSIGRSDLKILEYAMAGVVTVASDVPPYQNWTDGRMCLKAATAKEFLRAVQRLVRNQDEAKEMAARARTHVLEQRTIQRNVHLWEDAIRGRAASQGQEAA